MIQRQQSIYFKSQDRTEETTKEKLTNIFVNFDAFPKPVELTFSGGKTSYKTVLGALITIVIHIFVSYYAVMKFLLFYTRDDSSIFSSVKTAFYSPTEVFGGNKQQL